MKEYWVYTFWDFKDPDGILIGLLSQYPFESFEEQEDQMLAYIADDNHQSLDDKAVSGLKRFLPFQFEFNKVENKNWNEAWEASFKPVEIDQFCRIRADFHEYKEGFEHEICINPRMAFGTGHHETTFMMIQMMKAIDFSGCKVLDYGCGTGVLAILSEKLGAANILAIDYDPESVANTIDNAQINKANKLESKHAELSELEVEPYDVILANINRQVLLDNAERLKERLTPNGILLLSGILETDKDLVVSKYTECGFTLVSEKKKGEWLCLQWKS